MRLLRSSFAICILCQKISLSLSLVRFCIFCGQSLSLFLSLLLNEPSAARRLPRFSRICRRIYQLRIYPRLLAIVSANNSLISASWRLAFVPLEVVHVENCLLLLLLLLLRDDARAQRPPPPLPRSMFRSNKEKKKGGTSAGISVT